MHVFKGLERTAKKLVPDSWRKYFRASRYQVLMERVAPIDLIVHVGAHWGEDVEFYERCGADCVLWIEADPDSHTELARRMAARSGPTRHLTECALVSATDDKTLQFHRFKGNGVSSSVHRATEALTRRFPNAGESGEVLEMRTSSLPEILGRHGLDVTAARLPMLAVDVQGHELEVLRGLGDVLRQFAICKCEVSRTPFYEGGATFREVDAHMKSHGFRLASHLYMQVPRHGDVLFLRD